MSTVLDLDFGLMTMEMPSVPCESQGHADGVSRFHDDGEATHYAQIVHECPDRPLMEVYPVCDRFAAVVRSNNDDFTIRCRGCNTRFPYLSEWVQIIGPIGGGHA